MLRTRMEREWCENQYEDSPLVAAIELLGVLLGLFSRRWPVRLVGLLGSFDANPGIVGQAISPGCDHAIAFREAIENLHLIALADSRLHCLLVGAIVGARDQHIAASVRGCQDGCRWNDHRVRHRAR